MTLDLVVQIASWACFTVGGLMLVIGALGIIRLPGLTLTTLKLVLIGLFLFIAGPTASHAIANAAWVAGLKPDRIDKDEGALLGRKTS